VEAGSFGKILNEKRKKQKVKKDKNINVYITNFFWTIYMYTDIEHFYCKVFQGFLDPSLMVFTLKSLQTMNAKQQPRLSVKNLPTTFLCTNPVHLSSFDNRLLIIYYEIRNICLVS